MTQRNSGEKAKTSLSKKGATGTRSDTPARRSNGAKKSSNGTGDADWVTLRQASDQTGVSVSTLRNWYRKGLVNSRVEKGPNGAQRLVKLQEVGERVKAKTPADPTPAPETSSGGSDSVSKSLHELIEELAEARERAGRAEAKAELLGQQIVELRSQQKPAAVDENLKAENEMLRERLELLRDRTEELARRLDAEEVADVMDDEFDEPLVPPEEEDEYLAMTQRWKARRKRRKFARREAKLSRG